MTRFLQVIFSAVLLAAAIPNDLFLLGEPFLGLIALVPLYLVFSSYKSYKEAFFFTALHTITVHIVSSYWLAFFKNFAIFTLGASALGTGVLGAVSGLLLYLPFSKQSADSELKNYSSLQKNYYIPMKIIWFSSIYTLYEWIKSCGFLGYPWGTVSSAMFRMRIFIQIADITGTYGITFLTAMFSAVCAEGIILLGKINKSGNYKGVLEQYIRTAFVLCIFMICNFIYGTIQYFQPRKPIKYLNTVMVQQNADPWAKKSDNETILVSQKLSQEKIDEARAAGKEPDLIVWSEGCLKYAFPAAEDHYKYFPDEEPLISFIRKMGVPLLAGGPFLADEEKRNYYNAALLFDSEGEFRGSYGKNHLVPFAEVIPFTNIPCINNFLKKVIKISAGWIPGNQYVCFEISGHEPENKLIPPAKTISLRESLYEQNYNSAQKPYIKISTPICFGDAFPDVCRPLAANGAELLINMTDDSWSRRDSAEYQHFVIAAFRAIELRTTLARSTNAGYSAVVDPAGRIIADMPTFKEDALFIELPVYKRKETVYLKLGNWLPYIILIWAAEECLKMYFLKDKEFYSKRIVLKKSKKKKQKKKRK